MSRKWWPRRPRGWRKWVKGGASEEPRLGTFPNSLLWTELSMSVLVSTIFISKQIPPLTNLFYSSFARMRATSNAPMGIIILTLLLPLTNLLLANGPLPWDWEATSNAPHKHYLFIFVYQVEARVRAITQKHKTKRDTREVGEGSTK